MDGFGFASAVLDLHAQYSQVLLFFGIYTGEILLRINTWDSTFRHKEAKALNW